MMIHSDYLITGVLKIVKTDNGFSFSNPGHLKLPLASIYEGGHSVARNPRIQTMFRMIGFGDNIGSGFPTILHAWGEENWRKPDLCENAELHQVELKLWTISLMPPECTEHLNALFGSAYSRLSKNEQIILGTAFLEGSVTNARLQPMLGLHSTEIGRILFGLVEQAMLVADKKGRWTSYKLNDDYEISPDETAPEDLLPSGPTLKNKNDRIIYQYIQANGFITTRQVIEITSISTTQGAWTALSRLIEVGLVEKVRKGKQVIYQLKA
jgi:predicted HTH transcriptional regulator